VMGRQRTRAAACGSTVIWLYAACAISQSLKLIRLDLRGFPAGPP